MKYKGLIVLTLIAIGFIVLDRKLSEINKHLILTAKAVRHNATTESLTIQELNNRLDAIGHDNLKRDYAILKTN